MEKTCTIDEEIQAKLTDLEIEAKRTRNKIGLYVFLVVVLTIILVLLYIDYKSALYAVLAVLAGLLGAIYIVASAIPDLWQPLSSLDFAFKTIAKAIQLLKKSKSSKLAHEEASNLVRSACFTLSNVELDRLELYEGINKTFEQFVNNLKSLVPEIADGKISSEDLEKIAVALSSRDTQKLEGAFLGLPLKEQKEREPSRTKQLENFFSAHKVFANTLFVIVLVSSCIIFYYAVTKYAGISNNYAFAGSVALFIGILPLYFTLTRRK